MAEFELMKALQQDRLVKALVPTKAKQR